MKALCWQGKKDIRYETVPDPRIEAPSDAILKVTATAICGSDLHLFNGSIPTMMPGDVLGHEFMGEVVEVGSNIRRLKVGDRVIVPFTIWCGECEQCRRTNYSCCQRSNRNKSLADKMWGHTSAGLFGYSHITGGYAGGQAEYVRVPFADNAPVKVPDSLNDEQVLFLTDIFPTGWQGAAQADIVKGDTVAIWGCGPVAQFTIRSAFLLGAERVIAIDCVPERLAMARAAGAETLDFKAVNILEALNELTNGDGPDKCIDAVGMEAHGHGLAGNLYDFASQAMKLETGRPIALREAIMACKPGGTVSVPGVFGGIINAFPMGAVVNKALTLRSGQTHVNRWTDDLLKRIEEGEIDPSFVITHRAKLSDGPALYRTFRDKHDGCIKVVLRP